MKRSKYLCPIMLLSNSSPLRESWSHNDDQMLKSGVRKAHKASVPTAWAAAASARRARRSKRARATSAVETLLAAAEVAVAVVDRKHRRDVQKGGLPRLVVFIIMICSASVLPHLLLLVALGRLSAI